MKVEMTSQLLLIFWNSRWKDWFSEMQQGKTTIQYFKIQVESTGEKVH